MTVSDVYFAHIPKDFIRWFFKGLQLMYTWVSDVWTPDFGQDILATSSLLDFFPLCNKIQSLKNRIFVKVYYVDSDALTTDTFPEM